MIKNDISISKMIWIMVIYNEMDKTIKVKAVKFVDFVS